MEIAMPHLATLQAFAATVEANDHVGAITKFYAPDAATRENNNPPIVGREGRDHAAGAAIPRGGSLGHLLAVRVHPERRLEACDGGDGVADLAWRATGRGTILLRSKANRRVRPERLP